MGSITLKKLYLHTKKYWKIYLILILFIILLLVINSPVLLYEIPREITDRTGVPVIVVAVEKSNAFFRIFDEFNIFHLRNNLYDGSIPLYDLEFSANDIKHFNSVAVASTQHGSLNSKNNTWRNTKLYVNGKKYKAKIKLHGDLPFHWNGNLKSYKVKLTEGSINGLRRFTLILFEDRLLFESTSNILAQELELFTVRDDFIALRINGVAQGLYYLREDIGPDYLENNQCSSCVIFKTRDNFIEDHPRGNDADPNGVTDGPGHGTDFDDMIGNFVVDGEFADSSFFHVLDNLFEKLESTPDLFIKQFDEEYLTSFEAFRILIGSNHFIHGDNMRLVYSGSKGLFYPLPISEDIAPLKVQKGGIEHTINEDVPLFEAMARNDQLRLARNKRVYDFIKQRGNFFIEKIQTDVEYYLPYATSYKSNTYSRKYMKYRMRQLPTILENNFKIITQNLEYSKAYLSVTQKDNEVQVILSPDSISHISFDQFLLNLSSSYQGTVTLSLLDSSNTSLTREIQVDNSTNMIDIAPLTSGLLFSAGLDEDMYPSRQDYHLTITFPDHAQISVQDIFVVMRNQVTGKVIAQDDIYLQIANANNFLNIPKDVNELKIRYPDLKWQIEQNTITLKSGTYYLDKDLIIPSYSKFVIEPSTILALDSSVSIISYSPVEIEATPTSRVIIRAHDPQNPFGTFGILSHNTNTTIRGLDISGGSEKIINGIYFSGALSIHGSDVVLHDSIIHNNHADDGLNIKYGKVLVENTQFTNNFADQFDCDFCVGVIKDSTFKGTVDSNGDGLDFSGSKVFIAANSFQNFKDKGLSVGESTKAVVVENQFLDNNLAAAIKDASHVFFLNNVFKENNVAISSYKKKELFGGANSYNYQNVFENNAKDFMKDSLSKNYNLNIRDTDQISIEQDIKDEDIIGLLETFEAYQNGD